MYKEFRCSSGDDKSSMKSNQMDYLRLLFSDVHGILRGKVFPSSTVNLCGESMPSYSPWMDIKGSVSPQIIENVGADNIIMKPIADTLTERSWKKRRSGARIGQMLCELWNCDGTPVEEDVRRIANKQLDRLKSQNLRLFSATEFEFRLYKKTAGKELVPADNDMNMYYPGHLDMYEDFMVDMSRRLRQFKIRTHAIHDEFAKGQMEITHNPAWDIEAADWAVILRSLVKETAKDYEMEATFMSKDILDDIGNSSHFNHSVWRRNEDGKLTNAFYDPQQSNNFSTFGRQWLAGLMKHAPALTALLSPTVNCYRRINFCLAGPMYNNWGVDFRLASFRLKTGLKESSTYLENRIPSSCANLYLVLAANVAAGLDGVENKLDLVEETSIDLGALPSTLSEALEALKNDTVICEALGKRFVELYVKVKEEEIQHLKDVNVMEYEISQFKQEIDTYRSVI